MKKLHHQHLLIRAYLENPPKEVEDLNDWFASLVEAVGMKIVVPPKSAYVDKEGNRGLTGSVNIETSHSAVHIWDEESPAKMEMDLYSCSCFDLATVLEKLHQFGLVSYHYMMIDRNTVPFTVIDQGSSETEKTEEEDEAI